MTTIQQPPARHLANAEHWVEHGSVSLYVWEKYLDHFENKPVVILAHGSASAGRESFDLQVPGKPSYSLMDYLAQQGFHVFSLDVRGFGRSTRPPGHITTVEASMDLHAVVDYVLALRNIRQVHLLAWSWGTQYAGLFVMRHSEKVARYICYAQMHADSPDLKIRREKLEIYRANPYIRIPESGWKPRFYSMTPECVNDVEVIATFAHAATAAESETPMGPQLDLLTLMPMPMLDAREIKVPVMVIHGEYDDVADLAGLLPFFRDLPNGDKRYVVLPEGGHMLHLQKGHLRFQSEVSAFLK
ncbi:MAG: alpha/beta fold hydrolase [Oxalobacteraceae bacterium]|nr:MAG: alpha/beta fold hydrolase [Oxalobacteraceae bacterium]